MTADIEELFKVETPATQQLNDLEKMVGRALSLMEQLDSLDELTKQVKEELWELTTKQIPDAMAEAGTAEFKTTAGVKVSVKDFINGSLPKEDDARFAALSWIQRNGGADLIKDHVDMAFSKGEHNFAGVVKGELEKLGVTFSSKEDIHPQTLYAWVRERMRNGEACPTDLLGLFVGRKAKIQVP